MASGGLCFSRSITKSCLHQDDFSYATLLLFLNIYCEIIGSELSWEAGKPPETLLSKPGKAPRRQAPSWGLKAWLLPPSWGSPHSGTASGAAAHAVLWPELLWFSEPWQGVCW